MKRNDWSILISVLLYSILFYKQTAGINFFIFSSALVALLAWRNNQLLKNKVWLSVAAGTIVSSFFIFMYDSNLAIWANLFSLFILSAVSINPKTSFLTAIFLTMCSVGASSVFMFIDWANRKAKQATEAYSRPFYVKMFLVVIPFIIALLFFFFYQGANPLFYDLTKDINLDFISLLWILFTISGLLLMYGFFHNRPLPGISDADSNALSDLSPEIAGRKNFMNGIMRTDTEYLSGLILFSMLNILLLMVNVLDINYFLFDGKLPKGISHKAFVHDGIGTLITSLVVAIILLLFYFRGELNYFKNKKGLKVLALLWIAQNAFMIFSTAYRNNLYIEESGISYKKIGVYVYLALAMIGLFTTLIKIVKYKTNWYLFRVNAMICYFFLVIGCTLNWDMIITNFNIKKYTDEHKQLEKYLLLDLSFKNLPELMSLSPAAANADDSTARDYYNYLRGTYYFSFKTGLADKLYNFLDEYDDMEWPSTCLEKKRVYQEIWEMKGNVKELHFQYYNGKSLKPLGLFTELEELSFENGLKDFDELELFPKIKKLSLRNCGIDSLEKIPAFADLRQLDLLNNELTDIAQLKKFSRLEALDLSGYGNHIASYAPLTQLKNLHYLRISKPNTEEDLAQLKRMLPNVTIAVN